MAEEIKAVSLDDKIIELFGVVAKQKEEVAATEVETKKSWKTNCSFPNDNGNPTNIQTISESTLIQLLTNLLAQQDYRKKAVALLGLDEASHTIQGYSVDDWVDDFKKRIAVLNIAAKKKKLAALEDRLNSIVSPEQRRALELQEIMKDLAV